MIATALGAPLDPHVAAVVSGITTKIDGCRTDGYSLMAHSLNVAHSASLLAYAAGLGEHAAGSAWLAGFLHDAGKVDVPEYIHFKPGALTETERALMREHPVIGAEYLAGLGMPEIAGAVRYHHERLDGSGYPEGLAGDEIPVLARLVAVVDTYWAWKERRCYREAFAHEAAAGVVIADAERGLLDFGFSNLLLRFSEVDLTSRLAGTSCAAGR